MNFERIVDELEATIVSTPEESRVERGNMGVGLLADKCARAIWYKYRWVMPRGPMSFRGGCFVDTGNLVEDRIVDGLRAAGYTVDNYNPRSRTRQHGFDALGGVVRGYVDGYINLDGEWAVLEVKSMDAAKARKIDREGVEQARPEHYHQLQLYMYLANQKVGQKTHPPSHAIRTAVYTYIDRDKFKPRFEAVEFDGGKLAVNALARARRIAHASEPPPRISESPESWDCKWCDYRPVCHGTDDVDENCRTCRHASVRLPGDEGWYGKRASWFCSRHRRLIDAEATPCMLWERYP